MQFESTWCNSDDVEPLNQTQLLYNKYDEFNAYSNSSSNDNGFFFDECFNKIFPYQSQEKEMNVEMSYENQTTDSEHYSFGFQQNDNLIMNSNMKNEDKNLFIMNNKLDVLNENLNLQNNNKCNKKNFRIIKDFSKHNLHKTYLTNNGYIDDNNKRHFFKVLSQKRLLRLQNSINSDATNNINNVSLLEDICFQKGRYILLKRKMKRKFKPDDIRKKIKARFHKSLKNILNNLLEKAGSKKLFDFLPQCFLSNISKKVNHYALSLTMRELFNFDFCKISTESRNKNKSIDQRKLSINQCVLKYLDENPDIREKSGFNDFSQKTYGEILKEYFSSEEFLHSLKRLKYEKETEEYILEYKKKALNYVSFFAFLNRVN